MAYTPINWQTGDTITADKMNKMDNGWSVSEAQLFNETVTTTDIGGGYYMTSLAYTDQIEVDVLTVTYDGTSYTCSRIDILGDHYYGGIGSEGPDFSEFPFAIASSDQSRNNIYTETAGSHTVTAIANVVEVSADFEDAVTSVMPEYSFQIIPEQTTWEEAHYAFETGKYVYVKEQDNDVVPITFVGQDPSYDYVARGIRLPVNSDTIDIYQLFASSPDGVLQ